MLVQLKAIQDRIRSSLFFVPMLFVVGGFAVGQLALQVDEHYDDVPDRLTATVESARAVLTVVASATITFAGIAFSVSLLLISLASSQYSPRVVHGLFRDPFNKRIMGVVVGTFTYCLIVLQAVRSPLESGGQAIVPSISIAIAVVLGIVAILSIVGFISHAAHTMDVSRILHRVTEEALQQVRRPSDRSSEASPPPYPGDDRGTTVIFDRHGWIQQLDEQAMLKALEPGTTMWIDTAAGRYAVVGTSLCLISPAPADVERTTKAVLAAVVVGETRTMQQDDTYGVRQLADVALKALSPGVNDPTTAQDALFHLATVVRELLVRPAPRRAVRGEDDRVVVLSQSFTHSEVVGLAFDEVRIAARGQPTVQIYLLEVLHLLVVSLQAQAAPETLRALRHQADLVVAVDELADLPSSDHERVRAAHRSRFGP